MGEDPVDGPGFPERVFAEHVETEAVGDVGFAPRLKHLRLVGAVGRGVGAQQGVDAAGGGEAVAGACCGAVDEPQGHGGSDECAGQQSQALQPPAGRGEHAEHERGHEHHACGAHIVGDYEQEACGHEVAPARARGLEHGGECGQGEGQLAHVARDDERVGRHEAVDDGGHEGRAQAQQTAGQGENYGKQGRVEQKVEPQARRVAAEDGYDGREQVDVAGVGNVGVVGHMAWQRIGAARLDAVAGEAEVVGGVAVGCEAGRMHNQQRLGYEPDYHRQGGCGCEYSPAHCNGCFFFK